MGLFEFARKRWPAGFCLEDRICRPDLWSFRSLRAHGECPKRTTGWNVLQPFIAGIDNVGPTLADRHRDILHAVLLPCDWLALDAGSRLELPKLLAIVSVESFEFPGRPA